MVLHLLPAPLQVLWTPCDKFSKSWPTRIQIAQTHEKVTYIQTMFHSYQVKPAPDPGARLDTPHRDLNATKGSRGMILDTRLTS